MPRAGLQLLAPPAPDWAAPSSSPKNYRGVRGLIPSLCSVLGSPWLPWPAGPVLCCEGAHPIPSYPRCGMQQLRCCPWRVGGSLMLLLRAAPGLCPPSTAGSSEHQLCPSNLWSHPDTLLKAPCPVTVVAGVDDTSWPVGTCMGRGLASSPCQDVGCDREANTEWG